MQHGLAESLQMQFVHRRKLIHQFAKNFITHECGGAAARPVLAELNRAHAALQVALPYRLDLDEFGEFHWGWPFYGHPMKQVLYLF
jgi:hypothetical protein